MKGHFEEHASEKVAHFLLSSLSLCTAVIERNWLDCLRYIHVDLYKYVQSLTPETICSTLMTNKTDAIDILPVVLPQYRLDSLNFHMN